MKEKIVELCRKIEQEENIHILFAIENGSRVWRMASEDSDYDVRFVYVRPTEDYIRINKKAEVIDKIYEDREIDMLGFDVFKFVKLLWASNPTCIEWLTSDIVYCGEQNPVFKKFAIEQFKPISLYFHYKSMCRQNYLKYLKSGIEVTYKKYLYAMRGLVNAKFIATFRKVPPIEFDITLHKGLISDVIRDKLLKIIKLKKESNEKDIVQNDVQMDKYIEDWLKDDTEAPREKKLTTTRELDEELKRLIL